MKRNFKLGRMIVQMNIKEGRSLEDMPSYPGYAIDRALSDLSRGVLFYNPVEENESLDEMAEEIIKNNGSYSTEKSGDSRH